MIQWLQHPIEPLVAQYIECYWLIEKPAVTLSDQYPKLNPDPAAHFIISPPNQAFHYQTGSEFITGQGSHWLFPHQQTLQLDHSKPFVHLGIKFRVGALYSLDLTHSCHLDSVQATTIESLLRFSSAANAELNKQDRTQNHAHPLTHTAQSLIDLARLDLDKITKQLDVLFLAWLQSAKEDQHSQLTRKALSFLQDTSIAELGHKLNCSQRTVERSFTRVTGLTLKQCQTMNKLEAMLEYLYQRDIADIDWADIAARFGFSDQPHLIRTLKNK